MNDGAPESPAAGRAHAERARAGDFAAPGAKAVRRSGARAGARPLPRGRVRAAAAGAEHLGDARPGAAHCHGGAAHAGPRRETHRARAAGGIRRAGVREMSARAIKFTSSPVLVLRLPVWRSRLLVLVLAAGFAVLAGRAVYLQSWNNEFL